MLEIYAILNAFFFSPTLVSLKKNSAESDIGYISSKRVMHLFTLYGAVRPFGSCLMFDAYNKDDGPQLYLAEPSGVLWVRAMNLPSVDHAFVFKP